MPKWDELLQHFSSKPLGQYSSTLGTEDLYVIASALAKDVNEEFCEKFRMNQNAMNIDLLVR